MTDDDVLAGLQISKKYGVATGKSVSFSPNTPSPIHPSPSLSIQLPSPTPPINPSPQPPETMIIIRIIIITPFPPFFSPTACVKPYHITFAKEALAGSSVLVCPVIGFPHGNSSTEVKVFEASRAAELGGKEIDMVVNIGRVLSGKWDYVAEEIAAVNRAVVERGSVLKVIFENDCEFFLPPPSFLSLYLLLSFTITFSFAIIVGLFVFVKQVQEPKVIS